MRITISSSVAVFVEGGTSPFAKPIPFNRKDTEIECYHMSCHHIEAKLQTHRPSVRKIDRLGHAEWNRDPECSDSTDLISFSIIQPDSTLYSPNLTDVEAA